MKTFTLPPHQTGIISSAGLRRRGRPQTARGESNRISQIWRVVVPSWDSPPSAVTSIGRRRPLSASLSASPAAGALTVKPICPHPTIQSLAQCPCQCRRTAGEKPPHTDLGNAADCREGRTDLARRLSRWGFRSGSCRSGLKSSNLNRF